MLNAWDLSLRSQISHLEEHIARKSFLVEIKALCPYFLDMCPLEKYINLPYIKVLNFE